MEDNGLAWDAVIICCSVHGKRFYKSENTLTKLNLTFNLWYLGGNPYKQSTKGRDREGKVSFILNAAQF